MTVRWTGAFASLTNWPPDHAGQGWSNLVTNATTLLTGVAVDGDHMSAALWMERYGNVNFLYAQSRRLLWQDTFIGTGVNDTDPEDQSGAAGYTNAGNVFTSINCVYGISAPVTLTPNARRGPARPGLLSCQIRARRSGGAGDHKVRIYAVPGWHVLRDWGDLGSTCPYVEWTMTAGGAGTNYPATPGWNTNPSTQQDLDPNSVSGGSRGWAWRKDTHPVWAAGDPIPIRFPQCSFVVAGAGDGGSGPYIAAVEIWEEVPGA